MLAESWDVGTDYKQIKLNLRKGVQWHSGRELTSDDVKYNLLRAQDPKVGAGQSPTGAAGSRRSRLPTNTPSILKSENRGRWCSTSSRTSTSSTRHRRGSRRKTKAVGTGPFAFVEWVPGDHMPLARNKNYWQTGQPYLDGVRVAS